MLTDINESTSHYLRKKIQGKRMTGLEYRSSLPASKLCPERKPRSRNVGSDILFFKKTNSCQCADGTAHNRILCPFFKCQ